MIKATIKDIKINEICNSSGLFYGNQNIQVKFTHSSTKKEGLGAISGDRNTVHKSEFSISSTKPSIARET